MLCSLIVEFVACEATAQTNRVWCIALLPIDTSLTGCTFRCVPNGEDRLYHLHTSAVVKVVNTVGAHQGATLHYLLFLLKR